MVRRDVAPGQDIFVVGDASGDAPRRRPYPAVGDALGDAPRRVATLGDLRRCPYAGWDGVMRSVSRGGWPRVSFGEAGGRFVGGGVFEAYGDFLAFYAVGASQFKHCVDDWAQG